VGAAGGQGLDGWACRRRLTRDDPASSGTGQVVPGNVASIQQVRPDYRFALIHLRVARRSVRGGRNLAPTRRELASKRGATKAAVHSFSESLRVQVADTGVQVIELAPPGVRAMLSGR
jgi:NAD(P)-dependent dehydrogenase (short-subunit alcohol dehydrogenase family)